MILLIHPREKEYVSVTEETLRLRERERELFMVSKRIQLHLNLENDKSFLAFFEANLFKQGTSCQNQVSNS